MSDKNAKEIRKQLRNVVQEIIDDVLTAELCQGAYLQVQKHINTRLDRVDDHVKATLQKISDDAQAFQSFMMRAAADHAATKAVEQEAPKSE